MLGEILSITQFGNPISSFAGFNNGIYMKNSLNTLTHEHQMDGWGLLMLGQAMLGYVRFNKVGCGLVRLGDVKRDWIN